jgi:hypothetical protein
MYSFIFKCELYVVELERERENETYIFPGAKFGTYSRFPDAIIHCCQTLVPTLLDAKSDLQLTNARENGEQPCTSIPAPDSTKQDERGKGGLWRK